MQEKFYQQRHQRLYGKGGVQYAPGSVVIEWQVEPGGHDQPTDEDCYHSHGDGGIQHKVDLGAGGHIGELPQGGLHPGTVLQQMHQTNDPHSDPQPLMHGQAGEIEVKQKHKTNIKDQIKHPFEILFFHFFHQIVLLMVRI
ncbi:hypothetical protein SDC9_149123 [bioreactor metagenome]|uniref:Uncharacterized protein n=1 Tax=bioreactor metagenome TaxID=1076179 RepID=A0A645EKR3_9ZZZZ